MSNLINKWIFYDSYSKTQSQEYSTEEAQITLIKMRDLDINRFFIWTVGWEKWQPLKAYLETDQKYFANPFLIKKQQEETIKQTDTIQPKNSEPIENTISKHFSKVSLDEETMAKYQQTFANKSFDAEDLSLLTQKRSQISFEKLNQKSELANREERHELKIEILLITPNGRSFRSKSKNISLSGTLLEDSIPVDFCDITFDVVVVNKHHPNPKFQKISVKAKTIGAGLTQRIQFINLNDLQKQNLHTTLQDYMNLQNQKSKAG